MSGHTPTGFLERQPVEVTTSAGDAVLVRGYDSRLYPDDERVTIMNCVTNAGAQLPTEICEANAAYAAACWNAFLGSDLPTDKIEQGMVKRLIAAPETAAELERVREINADLLEALKGIEQETWDRAEALTEAARQASVEGRKSDDLECMTRASSYMTLYQIAKSAISRAEPRTPDGGSDHG